MNLPPRLNTGAEEELRNAFMARRGSHLRVEASAVEQVGGLCLQVLLSAKATWARDDRTLTYGDPSEAFLTDLETLGVDPKSLDH